MTASRRAPRSQIEDSEERQQQHHLDQISKALTRPARLRAAFHWLMAEARRADIVEQIIAVIIDLVYRVRKGLPLPDPAHGSPAWNLIETSSDRRDVA